MKIINQTRLKQTRLKQARLKHSGFTLLELLIAISISTFIIVGMMQALRNVHKMIARSRITLQTDKAVTLFFNQIERDFNTALIPIIAKLEKQDKDSKVEDKEEKEKASKAVGDPR